MKQLTISSEETWDEEREEFIPAFPPVTITIEHSLVSLSKWESKWHKPYLSTNLTFEETVDYIKCMTITQNVKPEVYGHISPKVIEEVTSYIEDPMTATWFSDEANSPHKSGKMNGKILTAELIYCWMIQMGIPAEFQKWHLNRLLTLIRVIGLESSDGKKMSKRDIIRSYASLNAERRKRLGTKG